MINSNPFNKLLAEKGLSLKQLSEICGIPYNELTAFSNNKCITFSRIEMLCKILRCQPCDLIEFSKTETKGHWEWIEEVDDNQK